MKQTIDFYDFERAFKAIRPDNFSYEGLRVLFEYFEEYEASTDEEVELDVIAICCDYCESTEDEIRESYDVPLQYRDMRGWLERHTTFVGRTDLTPMTYVYGAF